jgi:hypothetical protein
MARGPDALFMVHSNCVKTRKRRTSSPAFERGRQKVCPLLAQDPLHSF